MTDIPPELETIIRDTVKHFAQFGYNAPFVAFGDMDFGGLVLNTEYGEVRFVHEDTGTKTPIGDTGMFAGYIWVLPEVYYKRMKRQMKQKKYNLPPL